MPVRASIAAILASLCAAAVGCDSVSCNSIDPAAGNLCIPAAIQADQSATIEVREECGLCATIPSCETVLRDGAVFLTLHSQICSDAPPDCSFADCPQRIVHCNLPPLVAGSYPLVVTGTQNYLLQVQDNGQSSCRLPAVTQ